MCKQSMCCCECRKILDCEHINVGSKGLIWMCPDCGALTIEGTVSHREVQIVLERKDNMIYENARKASERDRMVQKCECPNGHTWKEWFYIRVDHNGQESWAYADSAGSTCPECGKQDFLDH